MEVGDDDVGSDVGMPCKGALVRGIFEGIIDGVEETNDNEGFIVGGVAVGIRDGELVKGISQ